MFKCLQLILLDLIDNALQGVVCDDILAGMVYNGRDIQCVSKFYEPNLY